MNTMLQNKTVIISGGASGIGLALAEELASQKMNVVIADIDENELERAQQSLADKKINVVASALDVTDMQQWQNTVELAKQVYGDIHMLINNAGVGGSPGRIEDTDVDTWKWVMDVNLMGVVYGTQAVTPYLKEHKQGGWIINVASMAGMIGVPYAGAYTASKAAVVAMTESWAVELAPYNIAVSALCPAFVKTQIHQSHRNRQAKYKTSEIKHVDKGDISGMMKAAEMVDSGIPPQLLAKRVVEALHQQQPYIFTHPSYQKVTGARAKSIQACFDDALKSEHVSYLADEKVALLK